MIKSMKLHAIDSPPSDFVSCLPNVLFLGPGFSPGSHMASSCPISDTLNQEQLPSLCFQALDSAGQLFCRISPSWDTPDTFSWLKLGYAFGTRVNYNWCCALLSVFKRSMMFPCLMAGDVNLDHLIKVASLMLLFPHYN